MPTLVAVSGVRRGVRIELTGSLTVGRDAAVDLQLVDTAVSGRHCRITLEGEGVRIEDLGSKNGTFVNGDRVDKTELKAGDEIAVGDSILVLDGQVDVMVARYGDSAALVVSGAVVGSPSAEATAATDGFAGAAALSVVTELSNALARAIDADAAAAAVVKAMGHGIVCSRVLLISWSASGRATLVRGLSEPPVDTPISGTLLRWVAEQRRLVRLEDAVEEERLRHAKSVLAHRPRSVAVAPVLAGDDLHGFLYVERFARRPFDDADASLLETLAAITGAHRLLRMTPPSEVARPVLSDRPAGKSRTWTTALETAERIAGRRAAVLITGETGSGKEVLARYIHEARGGPFVAVNCGAIPETLAESELFGFERGAFTGALRAHVGKVEAADGGTLFLDEIGELSSPLQVKLLRVLDSRTVERVGSTQSRAVDVAVIAATHRDLREEIRKGRFREDLFYRLNVVPIHVPPLRERAEDLEPIATALLPRLTGELGVRNPGLDPSAIAELARHRWPGNVRELANTLQRVLILRSDSQPGAISALEIRSAWPRDSPAADVDATDGPAMTLREACEPSERRAVLRALRAARGNKTRAAKILAISKPTLLKRMSDLAISGNAGSDE